ncbi:MAG TPA: ATP-binding protein [Anaerolineae bacterium]|nr:ATP-binding protein [Anaerolineae bacterium]
MPDALSFTLSPLLERALLYVAIAVATSVAFTNWRRGDAHAFREPLLAFFMLWFIQGALFAATAAPNLIPAPLTRGLDFATIVLLAWAFLAAALPARFGGVLLGGGMTLAAALSAFATSAARLAGGEPTWIGPAWSIGTLIVSGGTALTLFGLRRSPDRTSGTIAAFAVLALSAAFDLLLLPDLSRVCRLIGFSLFPLGLYQRALSDLRTTQDTLREFSESALRQTRELVTLLEASAYLFTSFDLDELLRKVVEHAASGIEADRALIALTDESAPQTLRVGSCHPRGIVDIGQTFALNVQPALALAMSSGEQVSVGPRGQGAAALLRLLNLERLGPSIVQPLSTQHNTLGVFIAANARDRREFSDGQKRLLEALGAQIAAAIVNAQLYRGLDAQARELAHVLATREQEAGWYASILESIGDGVLVTDKADQVILANTVAVHLLDTPLDYMLHRPLGFIFERLKPLRGAPSVAEAGRASGSDVVRASFEFGATILHLSLTPVHSLRGERLGVVAVFRDTTLDHQRDLSRIQFIGSIAQEFRTPLATIKGYADLLAKGAAGSLPAAALGFVETIRANAERLSAHVNAILQFNELDRGRIELSIEETDVASLLADAASDYRPRCELRNLALDVQVKPNLPSVRADRRRVRQVLDQLLDNALKFTPDGGQVRLSATPSWDGHSTDRPAFVAVAVADSGNGFDRAQGQRLFEAFYRGEGSPHVDQIGLGIGLPIARGLCEAMGGQLWAHSEKGHGAAFTFVLPVARVTDPRPASTTSESASLETWIEQALSAWEDDDRTRPARSRPKGPEA